MRRLTVLLACAGSLPLASVMAADNEQGIALLSFSANVQAFPTYRVKYKFTQATAASEQDALTGRWENSKSANATFVVDGDNERYECEAGPPPKVPTGSRAKGGTTFINVPFVSHRYLAGAAGAAGYSDGLRAINLFPKESGHSGMYDTTPMNMGIMGHRLTHGPNRLVADTATYDTIFLGKKTVAGREAIGIRCTKKQTGEVFEYWLDPSQGYLPLQMNLTMIDKRIRVTQLMSALLCSGGRWFPERVLSTMPKKPGDTELLVNEMLVTELDADSKLSPDDFYLKAPAGAQVIFQDRQGGISLKQDEVIYARDLPELFAKTERGTKERLVDTGLTHEQPRKWWWWCVGAGLLLLSVGFVRWRMKRPSAT
jgi:hypothetical protein